MAPMADRIMERVRAHDAGKWVCTPKDFLDLGERAAVDQALSRLVKRKQLRRVGRGLYDRPRFSQILQRPAPVNLDATEAALIRRDGIRIMPNGLQAANDLGLTTAVPAKACYLTDGTSRTVKVDGNTIQFRHTSDCIMQWTGKIASPVVQALHWLGPATADDQVAAILKHRLPDAVKQDLRRNNDQLPPWMLPLARIITADQTLSA